MNPGGGPEEAKRERRCIANEIKLGDWRSDNKKKKMPKSRNQDQKTSLKTIGRIGNFLSYEKGPRLRKVGK